MQPDTIARKKAQFLPFAVLCVIVIILCMALFPPTSAITIPRTVHITANYIGTRPVVDFTNSSDTLREGVGQLRVQFIDKTTGPHDNWEWDFGDKTLPSLENYVQNPVHIYENPGKYSVSLKVNSAAGSVTELKLDYVTVNSPITFTPTSPNLPVGEAGTAYSQTITAKGGSGSFTFSVPPEDLPPGLSLNSDTGLISGTISGTPTTPITYTFTITATDKNDNSIKATQSYSITVNPPPSSPIDTGGSDSGTPGASQAAASEQGTVVSAQSIDLSVNSFSIATSAHSLTIDLDSARSTGAIVTVTGNVVTITTPTYTLVFVAGKLTETKGVLTSQDVGSITLSTPAQEADIPGVGVVSGSVESGLDSISEGAEVNLTLKKPEDKDILAFEAAMKKEGKEIEAVAFTMTVKKTNVTATGPATITMTVPPDWVARNGGITAVSIVRTADDGTTQVLPTTFAGIDFKTGNLVFEALSKDGLSVFGLVTAKASVTEKAENPNATVVVASKSLVSTDVGMYAWMLSILEQNPVILVILLAVVALIAYFGWWKRRL